MKIMCLNAGGGGGLFSGAGGDGGARVILLDRDDQGVQPDFGLLLQPDQ